MIHKDNVFEVRNNEGFLHNSNGPAVVHPNGIKEWWVNGNWKGTEHYNQDGQLHREDGPAVEYVSGTKEWWVNGIRHREGGPAVECVSGIKYWYINGQLHRADGPALEYANGYKAWYFNGQLHREDGRRGQGASGDKEWYIKGQRQSESQFKPELPTTKGFSVSLEKLQSDMILDWKVRFESDCRKNYMDILSGIWDALAEGKAKGQEKFVRKLLDGVFGEKLVSYAVQILGLASVMVGMDELASGTDTSFDEDLYDRGYTEEELRFDDYDDVQLELREMERMEREGYWDKI